MFEVEDSDDEPPTQAQSPNTIHFSDTTYDSDENRDDNYMNLQKN
jgi:hypothetical protein